MKNEKARIMTRKIGCHYGATVLELLLVLAVFSVLLALGVKQYTMYKQSADFEQIKYNVDVLFQAMSNYYYANCENNTIFNIASTTPYLITPSQLVTGNYLTLANLKPAKVLTSGVYDTTYLMQFAPYSTTKVIGGNTVTVYAWKMQMAVNFVSSTTVNDASVYSKRIGADCVIKALPPTNSCSVPGTSPTLSFFSRMPSSSNLSFDQGGSWLARPVINSFKAFTDTPATPNTYRCGG